MYIILLMILSAVLAALSSISIVKNFLVSFNVSDNGWKTALVAILVVIALLGALLGYTEAYTVRDIRAMLLAPETIKADIENLKSQIPLKTTTSTVAVCVGFAAYALHIVMVRSIKEYKLKLIESNQDTRWLGKV